MSPSLSEQTLDFETIVGASGVRDISEKFAIDSVEPLAVVAPSSEHQLREVVSAANRDGVAVFPRGGGTLAGIGGIPDRPGIVVDMTNLNRVVAHNPADMTATFQAGASFQLVSEVLLQQGQFLAIDPPIPRLATVGGTLATGITGPSKWHFNHPRDTVIGMKVVQPDGELTKSGGQVVKNVSGYDMSRLHIGGLGTLGIILETSFKLTPVPMYEKTLVATFDTHEMAMDAAMRVFNSQVMPLALTGFDDETAIRSHIEVGDPGPRLAVRLGGRSRTLDRQVDEVAMTLRRSTDSRLNEVEGSSAAALWRSLADFGWTYDASPDLRIKLTGMPAQTGSMIEELQRLRTPTLNVAVVTHPGFGVVEGNWFSNSPEVVGTTAVIEMIEQVRLAASRLKCSAVVQRCPVEVKRAVDVWGGEPAGIEVMRRMKSEYDPNGIMNPGRFIRGI